MCMCVFVCVCVYIHQSRRIRDYLQRSVSVTIYLNTVPSTHHSSCVTHESQNSNTLYIYVNVYVHIYIHKYIYAHIYIYIYIYNIIRLHVHL